MDNDVKHKVVRILFLFNKLYSYLLHVSIFLYAYIVVKWGLRDFITNFLWNPFFRDEIAKRHDCDDVFVKSRQWLYFIRRRIVKISWRNFVTKRTQTYQKPIMCA